LPNDANDVGTKNAYDDLSKSGKKRSPKKVAQYKELKDQSQEIFFEKNSDKPLNVNRAVLKFGTRRCQATPKSLT
jgi:hypothetical protein